MAKATESQPAAAGTNAATAVQTGPATAAPSHFRVTLNCPTPIAHKSLVVAAATDEDARAAFMRANGISFSGHEWRVEKTTEPVTDLTK